MGKYYDAQGNEIVTQPLATTPVGNTNKTYNASGDEIPFDKLEQSTGPRLESDSPSKQFIRNLPDIGGTAGMFLGPGGATLGAGLGSAIKNFPGLLDSSKRKDAALNIVEDTGVNALMEGLANPMSRVLSKAKDYIMNKAVQSFPVRADPSDVFASLQSKIPMSVGQATGNKTATGIERLFAGSSKKDLEATQSQFLNNRENQLRQQITGLNAPPPSPTEAFGQEGVDAIKGQMNLSRARMNSAYDVVKNDAAANQVQVQIQTGTEAHPWRVDSQGNPLQVPKFKDVNINGPIIYPNTAGFIRQVKPEIDTVIDRLPDSDPLKSQLGRFSKAMDQLDKGLVTKDGSTKYIADWETVKQFRTDINSLLANKTYGKLSRGEGGLKTLADSLGRDIEGSMQNWAQTPDAAAHLADANAIASEHYNRFNERVRDTTFGTANSPADPSQIYKTALSRPEAAREMIDALGPQEQRSIKGYFFENLMDKAESNPDKGLELLKDPSFQKVLSSKDRADMDMFFRTMRRTAPDTSEYGKWSIALRGAGIALALGSGAVESLTGEKGRGISIPAALGATALIGTKQFAEKVLLDPRFARSATRLATLDPGSNEALFLRKSLLTAMRGVKMLVEDNRTGESKPAEITQSGKIKMLQ